MSTSSSEQSAAHAQVRRLASGQGGVVARHQVLQAGLTDDWIARQVNGSRWQRVHPRVYATVTGSLPRRSRWFAALLYAGEGAALADDSALQADGMTTANGDSAPVVVAVDHSRRVRSIDGVKVLRIKDLARLVHPVRRPARLRVEPALLLKASRARRPDDAIAVLADACRQRLTTAARLREYLAALPHNLRHRRVIAEVLDDVGSGAYSFIGVHYLRGVERPHGLPTGSRQRRVVARRRIWFRDVEYVGLALGRGAGRSAGSRDLRRTVQRHDARQPCGRGRAPNAASGIPPHDVGGMRDRTRRQPDPSPARVARRSSWVSSRVSGRGMGGVLGGRR